MLHWRQTEMFDIAVAVESNALVADAARSFGCPLHRMCAHFGRARWPSAGAAADMRIL